MISEHAKAAARDLVIEPAAAVRIQQAIDAATLELRETIAAYKRVYDDIDKPPQWGDLKR